MVGSGSFVYERELGPYDDGGTGSDMRRVAVWNHETKQEERYHSLEAGMTRVENLNKIKPLRLAQRLHW